LAFALSKLGLIADAMKEYPRAMQYHQESRDILVEFGDLAGEAYTTSRMSLSAFGMGQHAKALQFGRAGYAIFAEIGHRWGMTVSLCRIGFSVLGLGEMVEARICFHDALERALAFQMNSLALYALAGMACVFAEGGDAACAVELIAFVRPRSPAIYLETVEPWLSDLGTKMLQDEYSAAEARGKAADLEAVAAMVLRDRVPEQKPP
jgi:hypothetical protein